ncbi:hypothetical protein [Polaribacter glomeratus]|uniref:Uncharacterized protein n=1 Tax=Polaribacter glomeratus TaxID=102 RepID=A0A2S7WYQ6_9FLAO|nr:hypothetical protein [Polaribacter glomeratus]PQJ82727.1 hypothetical protein BTO16_09125 [Polaribacter glomeratus]TXD65274.1 hypothetical protein ESX12_10615 [Polaribacter glomeratus]
MKKLLFIVLCLSLSLTSCREDKKKQEKPKVETEGEVNIETPQGSIKTDKKGNVDITIKDK